MAVIQAALALLSRSLARIVTALFGWAVMALFGATTGSEKIRLSALVGAAAAWPLLLVGVVWPRAAAFALAFVPVPDFLPDWSIRLVWTVLALAVPVAVGVALATRSRGTGVRLPGTPGPPPRTPLVEPRLVRLLRGVPTTLAIAASFFIVFITVPAQRAMSIVRRLTDVRVPLVTDAAAYRIVADEIAHTLGRHGFAIAAATPPLWVSVPSHILRRLGGPSFQDYVPEQLAYFRGPRLEVTLYPSSLLLRGPEQDAAWAQGILAEALADAPAYQTFDPGAQDTERQIRSVWAAFRRNPTAHAGSPWLERRLEEIARDIRTLRVSYDEWQIVYRQALQLGRALRGERQLIEKTGPPHGNIPDGDREEAATMLMNAVNGDAARAQTLSTRELIREITDKAALLARKEIELAKTEIKADLQSEIAMAKGLGLAALAVLLGLNLLPVAAVIAMAPYVRPWLGALALGGALVLIGGIVGYVSWTRRVSNPLPLTRKTLKEDMQWAKEQLA